MAIQKGLVDSLKDLIDYRLLDLFTMIPARVTTVDYNENHLNAQPLIKTKYSDGRQLEASELFHVPIFILSANKGGARITLPVKVGDTVLVLFSQRSIGGDKGFYNSDGQLVVDTDSTITHNASPIMALPCLFTKASAKTIDSENIVVENGSTTLVMEPSGPITATCPTFIINGDVEINGNTTQIGNTVQTGTTTQTGDVAITGSTSATVAVSAPTLTAVTSLTVASKEMGGHTHPQAADSNGDTQANTGPPV